MSRDAASAYTAPDGRRADFAKIDADADGKVSLSERFGLWLSFYPFSQDDYLAAAQYWVADLGGQWDDQAREAALLWHRTRGARSGRVAWQFARDFVGRE